MFSDERSPILHLTYVCNTYYVYIYIYDGLLRKSCRFRLFGWMPVDFSGGCHHLICSYEPFIGIGRVRKYVFYAGQSNESSISLLYGHVSLYAAL